MKLNQESINITKKLSYTKKREYGIFFTPNNIIDDIINRLKLIIKRKKLKFKSILEPSCGSCNFIKKLDGAFRKKTIYGIEYNTCIFKKVCKLKLRYNNLRLIHKDFLKHKTGN